MSDLAPMRSCCFKRHYGVVCPDGKVMCCHCFERFEISDLSTILEGIHIDVCKTCAEKEKEAHVNLCGHNNERLEADRETVKCLDCGSIWTGKWNTPTEIEPKEEPHAQA